MRVRNGFIWVRIWPNAGSCEERNESLSYTNGGSVERETTTWQMCENFHYGFILTATTTGSLELGIWSFIWR